MLGIHMGTDVLVYEPKGTPRTFMKSTEFGFQEFSNLALQCMSTGLFQYLVKSVIHAIIVATYVECETTEFITIGVCI